MSAYESNLNFFVKDYEELRQTLKTIFLYGCYDREQLQKRLSARGYRFSLSRCDDLLQIVRYFWRDAIQSSRMARGKKIHYFPAGRYQTRENSLWQIYRMKSIQERDMNLFFFIPYAVRHIAKGAMARDVSCTLVNVCREICDDTGIYAFLGAEKAIWQATKELKAWGFLAPDPRYAKRIRASSNFLDNIPEPVLRQLHELLFFYRDVLPLSTLGYSLQRTIHDYLVFEQGKTPLPEEGLFVHKDVFLQNILNDEIMFQLLGAIENKKLVCFQCDSRRDNERVHVQHFMPLKIIVDIQYGRQFVLGEMTSESNSYKAFRLDKMSKLYYEKEMSNGGSVFKPSLDYMWTSSCQFQETHTVVVDFVFPEPQTAAKKILSLRAQQRTGTLTEVSPLHFVYTIILNDPVEMIPWLRSWMPYAHVRRDENPSLANAMEEGCQELLDIYMKKSPHTYIKATLPGLENHIKIPQKRKLDTSTNVDFPCSLFLEYRNLYFCAIHAAMHLLAPRQKARRREKWSPADLVHFILSYVGIDNTADKYLTTIAKYGNDPKSLSLFKEVDGVLCNAYPGSPPPIMPGRLEQRYLRTLLGEPGVRAVLGNAVVDNVCLLMEGITPFAWGQVLEERGVDQTDEPEHWDTIWKKIHIIMEAIRKKTCLSYENRARDSVHQGILKPYKIMYSPQSLKFQLIAAATDTSGGEPRLVLINIRRLSQIGPANGMNMDVDVKELLSKKKEPPLHIVIRKRIGVNDIERAFLLFSNYERTAWYDNVKDEYHIKLVYYSFQYKSEILPRILSLGAAAEVLSPRSVRQKIIDIVKQAINNKSQFF